MVKKSLEFEAMCEKEQKGISDAIYETISSETSSDVDEDEQMQASRERVHRFEEDDVPRQHELQ